MDLSFCNGCGTGFNPDEVGESCPACDRDAWKARAEKAEAVQQVQEDRTKELIAEAEQRALAAEAERDGLRQQLQAKIVDAAIVAEGRKLQETEASCARMRAALEELTGIVQGFLDGEDVVFDSFTLQAARAALSSSAGSELLAWARRAVELILAGLCSCHRRGTGRHDETCPWVALRLEAERLGVGG